MKTRNSSFFFSDVRISDRLDDIDQWRKILQYTINDIEREIQAIQSAKEQCERYLEQMRTPLGKNKSQKIPLLILFCWRCCAGKSRDTRWTKGDRQCRR